MGAPASRQLTHLLLQQSIVSFLHSVPGCIQCSRMLSSWSGDRSGAACRSAYPQGERGERSCHVHPRRRGLCVCLGGGTACVTHNMAGTCQFQGLHRPQISFGPVFHASIHPFIHQSTNTSILSNVFDPLQHGSFFLPPYSTVV